MEDAEKLTLAKIRKQKHQQKAGVFPKWGETFMLSMGMRKFGKAGWENGYYAKATKRILSLV